MVIQGLQNNSFSMSFVGNTSTGFHFGHFGLGVRESGVAPHPTTNSKVLFLRTTN